MLKIMSSLLSRLGINAQGGERSEITDARTIYAKLMTKSRQPVFFGANRFADSYDGRMEALCLHLSPMHHVLMRHGVHGERLAQALYDVMIADFDVALREQALSDTAVVKRIKPLAKMYFERLAKFKDICDQTIDETGLKTYYTTLLFTSHQAKSAPDRLGYEEVIDGEREKQFTSMASELSRYSQEMWIGFHQYSLGELALAQFEFPKID